MYERKIHRSRRVFWKSSTKKFTEATGVDVKVTS
jgi:hypothetical protein